MDSTEVGNQLPILLIDFWRLPWPALLRWESVTNPLDRLHTRRPEGIAALGISYQSS